jgi:predicted signal transduction protein with EAL and GGDEF domain
MRTNPITPTHLAVQLLIYFVIVIAALATASTYLAWAPFILPIGGHDLDLPGTAQEIFETVQSPGGAGAAWETRLGAALALTASLAGTILLMVPITWVYMATKFDEGYRKSFVDALIVLPICATSIVLLIQDSLALAFGLAALVAAVRFRVRLRDALDGIYIFAAICVGLASGVGYLGVGVVMTVFFCFASVILWGINYGANPVEDARQARKLAKLESPATDVE